MNPRIGVLALQGDFEAHARILDKLGVPWKLVRKAADFAEISGLIVPGGESTTFLKHLEDQSLLEPLRRFVASHPVFGTCAGAILMADKVENPPQQSLGLIHATIRRNAYGRQLSSSIRTIDADPRLFSGGAPQTPLEAVLIRAPQIVEVRKGVEVLASLDGQPVLIREGAFLAATFHPELSEDTRVHRYFALMVAGFASGSLVTESAPKA